MPEAAVESDYTANGAEEAPGWSYYISAVDALLDNSPDECDILAVRAERLIDGLKKQRGKLMKILEGLSVLSNRYGLKRITVDSTDDVGLAAYEIDNVSREIIAVFANAAPSLEQLHKILPSSERVRWTENKLDSATELLHALGGQLAAIFIDFPTRVHQLTHELQRFEKLAGAYHFVQSKQRLDAMHQGLLASQEAPGEMPLSHVLNVAGGDAFEALDASVASAEEEWKSIKAEKDYWAALLSPRSRLAPLVALAALTAVLVCLRGWAAFGVAMCTLAFSIASGFLGIFVVLNAQKKNGKKPDFYSDNGALMTFGLYVPLAWAALQFLGAIGMAIVLFFFEPRLHPFFDSVLPLGTWPRFFGFIVLGPLACLLACSATMAVYYFALTKLDPTTSVE